MQTNFPADPGETPDVRVTVDTSEQSKPNRESVRLLLIGSRPGINHVIKRFHCLNVAEMDAWSRFLDGPKPGKVMRIATLHFYLN